MRIGQLAERLGVNPRTIRYYERIALLPQPNRQPSGYRVYAKDDLDRLTFIRLAQRFGLRLDAIGEILALRDRGERPCEYVLSTVRHELDDVDRRIAELETVRTQLVALLVHADTLASGDGGRYCELLEHQDNEEK